jgi:symplekin
LVDRKIRLIAINTVKRWVPDTSVMSDMVLAFAQDTFIKLTQSDEAEPKSEAVPVTYTYLPETISLPASQETVQQYSELLFALSVRESQLLDQ